MLPDCIAGEPLALASVIQLAPDKQTRYRQSKILLFSCTIQTHCALYRIKMIHAAITLAVSLLVYINSINGGFVFDDHRGILENKDLRPEERSLWQLLNNDFWGGSMTREASHKSYRPITVLSYRYLNYAISGLSPFSYHLVNVLLHGVVCLLFLYLCRIVQGRGTWSLFSALLFAVHSVHTEAVSAIHWHSNQPWCSCG